MRLFMCGHPESCERISIITHWLPGQHISWHTVKTGKMNYAAFI